MAGHILYLALAVARGHLMRAHLLRQLLTAVGLHVEVITTSEAGRAFLAELGTPAEVLSDHFAIEYDPMQNLERGRTELGILHYLTDPQRGFRDLRVLANRAQQADLVVNDSLHPTLLLASLWQWLAPMKVVHLHGENLWQATERHFEAHLPWILSEGYATLLCALKNQAFGEVIHTLEPIAPITSGPGLVFQTERIFRLPPLISCPRRSPQQVRAELGFDSLDKLAVVYLNPLFRAPFLAAEIEDVLARTGFHLYGVSEVYGYRPGWQVRDPYLVDIIAGADVYISGLGMGALAQVELCNTPFIGLLTDQPEQIRNAAYLKSNKQRFRVIPFKVEGITTALHQAINNLRLEPGEAVRRPDPHLKIEQVQRPSGLSYSSRLSSRHRPKRRWEGVDFQLHPTPQK